MPKSVEPEPAATFEDVVIAHILKTRHMFMVVAAFGVLMVAAMGIGAFLIYHNLSNPNRTLAVVDSELARRDRLEAAQKRAEEKQNEKLRLNFCRLLTELPHTPSTDIVRADFLCPGTPEGDKAIKSGNTSGTPRNSTTNNDNSKTTNNTTNNPPPKSSPPPKSPSPRPSPPPKCVLHNPLTGECVSL